MIGYARSDPGPQAAAELARQAALLLAAGCRRIFTDVTHPLPNEGTGLRQALSAVLGGECLAFSEPGTVTHSALQWTFIRDRRLGRRYQILSESGDPGTALGRYITTLAVSRLEYEHGLRGVADDSRTLQWIESVVRDGALAAKAGRRTVRYGRNLFHVLRHDGTSACCYRRSYAAPEDEIRGARDVGSEPRCMATGCTRAWQQIELAVAGDMAAWTS